MVASWAELCYNINMEGQTQGFARWEKPLRIGLVVVIVLAVILILVLGVIMPAVQHANQATTVEFGIAPAEATIEVNGNTYTSGVYEDFAPGTYTAEVSAEGFDSKTINFTVEEHQANTVFDFLNNPTEGLDCFLRSDTDLATLRKVNNAEVQEWLAAYDQTLTIKDQLPYTVRFEYNQPYQYYDLDGAVVNDFRPAVNEVEISDGSAMQGCDLNFCLWVNLGSVGQDVAAPPVAQAIRDLGYDPNDYYIIYR